MRQNNFNQLEDILTTKDITLLNRHTYVQNELISTPTNKVEQKPDRLRAQGNAQVRDFIRMVGLIVESLFEDKHVVYTPYEKTYSVREDMDQTLNHPYIAWRVVHREYKDKSSIGPYLRDSIFDDEGRSGEVSSECFKTRVRFYIINTEMNLCWDLMDEFEDMMIDYKSHIKKEGIVNYFFDQQLEDDFAQDFRDIVSILTLDYIVLTEKNRVIFRENTKSILLRGEAVNEDGSPMTATGEVYTDDEAKVLAALENNTDINKNK